MKLLTRVVLLAFIVMFSFNHVETDQINAATTGQTYYINNTVMCADTFPGISMDEPWCNISNVNSKKFMPGDKILLSRGAVWKGQTMKFDESGLVNAPITLDAYGKGPKPIINGRGQATDRGIILQDASFWNIRNLEVGYTGTGILFYYSSLGHEGLNLTNLYVHHNVGIVKGLPANSEGINFSAGITFTGGKVLVGANDYIIKNANFENIEGAHNQNSIAIDWNNGQVGAPTYSNAAQNFFFNNLYFHDDDGNNGTFQSSSCSDSFRLVNITNVLVINSKFTNVAACHSPTGTAAIFTANAKDVTFINNMISEVPNTNSFDQSGLNLEVNNNQFKILSNYIESNQGTGMQLLAIKEGNDTSYNHTIDGNFFINNKGGGILQHGTSVVPTGTINNNIHVGSVPMLMTSGGGTFNGFSITNNSIVAEADISSAAKSFSTIQSTNNWSYQYKNPDSTWVNLPTYESETKTWAVNNNGVLQRISQFEFIPGNSLSDVNHEVAKAWKAPKPGVISIRGRVLKSEQGGNGVLVRITKNGQRIWPAAGDQFVSPERNIGLDTHMDQIQISTNDIIRFEVASNGDGELDRTSWSPIIYYTDSFTARWDFNTDGNTEGWSTSNTKTIQSVSNGFNKITATDSDPKILSPSGLNFDASKNKVIKIKMRMGQEKGAFQLFFKKAGETNFTEASSKIVVIPKNATQLTEYIIDLSGISTWNGTIDQLRFDPLTTIGTAEIDYIYA